MSSPVEIPGTSIPDFLVAGGEMGALMRAHDWASTSMGPPSEWPASLKTAVRLILNAGHPMYIWWGPDLLCFYNDAYSRTLGPERHPGSLGQPGREVWAEIWHLIGPQVDYVMAGRGSTWDENRLVPSTRFGRLDEIYWTYSYCPIDDETAPAGVGGVLVVCTETTQIVLAERQRAAETERQRRLFEQAPGFIAILAGPDHVFEFANAAFRRLIGGRETIGRPARDAIPEVEGQGFFELLDRVFQTGERFVGNGVPIRLRAAPGLEPTSRHLDFIYEPIRDEGGTVTGTFVEGYDVTERMRAEAKLRESEARLARALDAGDLGVWELDLETLAAWRSPQHDRIFGYETMLPEWTYQIALEHVVPEDRAYFDGKFQEAITGSGHWDFECRIRRPDGELRWIWARGKVDDRADGQPGRMKGMVRDITERRRIEQSLRESEARFRLTADAVPQIVWITDPDGRAEFFNKQWSDYTGAAYEPTTAAEVAANYVHPDDAESTMAAFDEARRNGTTYEVEHRILSRHGDYRWFLVRGEPYRDPDTGEITKWFGASVDINDRKIAEASLRELNDNLEHRVAEALAERQVFAEVIESTDAAVLVCDLEYRVLAINAATAHQMKRVYGRSPTVGENLLDALSDMPAHRAQVEGHWGRALAGETFVIIDEFGAAGHERAHYEVRFGPLRNRSGKQIGAYQTAYDVTDRVRSQADLAAAQEALRQSQKMEAMGSLTGGVAHDFNNLLTPIIGSLDLLQRRSVGSEREQRLIAGAMQSAERAKTLVRRLLAFARRQPLQPSSVDVGRLVEGMADLLGSTTGPQVRVVVEVADDLPPAKADPNQLEMALLNLGVNARDAMGRVRLAPIHTLAAFAPSRA